MRCKCGHSFRWTAVARRPCCQLSWRASGTTASACGARRAPTPRRSRARLGAYRATIAVGAAPLAAAVAALAAAAIAVWGPVVAVATVRRRRRRRKARERAVSRIQLRGSAPKPSAPRAAGRGGGGGQSGAIVEGSSQRSEYRFRRLSHADPLRNTLMVAMPHEHQGGCRSHQRRQRIARTAARAAADAHALLP